MRCSWWRMFIPTERSFMVAGLAHTCPETYITGQIQHICGGWDILLI